MTNIFDNIDKFVISTDTNSNKNMSSITKTFDQAATSVAAGNYIVKTYSVNIPTSTRLYQIYINLSIDGDYWTTLPTKDRKYNNGLQRISANISQSSNNIVLNLWLQNLDSNTYIFPAMVVSVTIRTFIDEIG